MTKLLQRTTQRLIWLVRLLSVYLMRAQRPSPGRLFSVGQWYPLLGLRLSSANRMYLIFAVLGLMTPTLSHAQTLSLGNIPTSICVNAPIGLTVLPTPGVDLSIPGLAITASTTSGTLAVSALDQNGAFAIRGGQLTVGNNQPVTIAVRLAGITLASTTINLDVLPQPTIPAQPAANSLTATVGSVLSLSGLCPTGTLVNLSNLTDLTGIINVPTTAVGVQSLSILCNSNGCISPVRVVEATVVPLLFNVLNNGPICLNQAVSLTVVPGNFSLTGNNPLVNISVSGPAGLSVSALDANGVLTVSGLTSGLNNLSVVASVAGSPVATVEVPITANPVPDPVAVASITALEGTTVSLTALCPTGVVSTSGLGGISPLLTIPTTTVGVQVLPLLCAGGNGCNSPITSVTVIVLPNPTNQAPTVVGSGIADPQSGTVGVAFTSNVSGAFSDPDGNALTFTASGLPAGLGISAGGTISGTPSQSGVFSVTVTANDGNGGTVSDDFTLNIAPAAPTNQAPVLSGTPLTSPQNATVGVAFSTSTAQAFTDPDGGPLTFTAGNLPTGVSINPTTGVISGAPTVSGGFNVIVTATDPQGASVATGFTLNVAPAAPVNQSPTVVGSGITDPQSGTVGVVFTSNVSGAFTDPDGNPLTFTATSLPAGVGISSGGIISGTPSQSGSFGVTVTANDGNGGTVSDTFTLTISPASSTTTPGTGGPLAATVVAYNCQTGAITFGRVGGDANRVVEYMAIGVRGYSTDPNAVIEAAVRADANNSTVTVMARYVGDAASAVQFVFNFRTFCNGTTPPNQSPTVVGSGIADPQSGTVGVAFSSNVSGAFSDPDGNPLTFSATGLSAGLGISAGGIISGTPSQSGTFGVTVTANDGNGGTVSDTFTLNIAPAGSTTPPVTGGPLAATVVAYNCQTGAITFGRVGGDANRTVEYMAIGVRGYSTDPNAVIEAAVRADANSNSITVMARYVGDAASAVQFVFNFRAFCSGVTPPPTNQSPTYTNGSLTNQVGTVGVPFSYGIPANAFTNPEGGALTYSASGLPAGLLLNGSTISGTPSQSGVYGVTITARDPQNAIAQGTFQITINPATPGNQAPTASTIPNQTATAGASFSYGIPAGTFTDPEGQPLTYSATGLPRGLGFSGSTFSGVPTQEGTFQITVTARDSQNASASTTFTLTVLPSSLCGSDPATFGQPLQALQPTYNCQTGTIKFNVQGGDGSVIEFGAIGITPFQTNCFETMDTEVAQDVRDDKSNVEPFQIIARQNGRTSTFAFDARAYCRPGGAGNPIAIARLGVLEPMGELRVTVFGNPTAGETIEVEVAGAEGKPLMLRMADAQGKVIGQQATEKAGAGERFVMPLGKSAGMYLLQVSTPTQVQSVKVLRQ